MSFEKVVKPEIRSLLRIKDTFDERYEYLRLEKNERLFPFGKELFEKFKNSLREEHLSGYYELGTLYRKLGRKLGVAENQIFLAAGSDLAIKSVFESCVEKGDEIILPSPCYAMDRVYANMFGARMKFVEAKEDWSIDPEEMLSLVGDRTKLAVIENPNGSTGVPTEIDKIEKCATGLERRGALLLVDEAYHFIDGDGGGAARLIKKHPNVVVAQSFSKAPGLAGLRVGHIVGDAGLVEYVSRVRPMHEISSLSALAAEWALENPSVMEEYRASLREAKVFLKNELEALGAEVKDTSTNFILARLPGKGASAELAEKLKERKIIIKKPFEQKHLEGWTRLTVGPTDCCRKLVAAIRECL